MKFIIAFVAFVVIVMSANAQQPILIDPQSGEYLGTYSSNPYDYDSISNPYGPYGNPYGNTVTNPYSQYGNPYSVNSINNPYVKQDWTYGKDVYFDK